MDSNLINIKLIKVPRNQKDKKKYLFPSFKLSITNKDNFLTEKIISKKLSLKNLYYKTIIYDYGDFQKIIRNNFIPKYFLNETLKDIEKRNSEIFSKKKIFSKSEKDNIKYIEANTKLNELNDILDMDDIKKFTHENRTYENIEQFINSKNKASKLLTEQRKKKIVFSTQSRMHFEDKIEYENDEENPFMKNEWFMGPIYSYDYNYEKYI